MSQDSLKLLAAQKALSYVQPEMILGIGSGSTVNIFIEELAKVKNKLNITKVICASKGSEDLLRKHGFDIFQPNEVTQLELYIDGADEVNYQKQMIKGGGAALTREKVLASMAKKFICIVDESKLVATLGKFPLPIEVIPFAVSTVSKKLFSLGGQVQLRTNVTTDNGNLLLDAKGFIIDNPKEFETILNNIPGVVTNGVFAYQTANIVIVAKKDEIMEF